MEVVPRQHQDGLPRISLMLSWDDFHFVKAIAIGRCLRRGERPGRQSLTCSAPSNRQTHLVADASWDCTRRYALPMIATDAQGRRSHELRYQHSRFLSASRTNMPLAF